MRSYLYTRNSSWKDAQRTQLCNHFGVTSCYLFWTSNHDTVVEEAGVQGVQAHPQKFWFVEKPGKIRENLGKIYENVRKIPEHLGKLPENTGKNGACRITWRRFFWGVIPKKGLHDLCGRKYSHKKFPENFLGKFGENRAKIFRTPKYSPAPTPMSRYM